MKILEYTPEITFSDYLILRTYRCCHVSRSTSVLRRELYRFVDTRIIRGRQTCIRPEIVKIAWPPGGQ